jgi:hypothetical protein
MRCVSSRSAAAHLGAPPWAIGAAFTALNTALMQDGAVLHVAKGHGRDAAPHPERLDAQGNGAMSHPRNLWWSERAAQATVGGELRLMGDVALPRPTVSPSGGLADGATLDHYKVQRDNLAGVPRGHIEARRAATRIYHSFSFAIGANCRAQHLHQAGRRPGANRA